MEGFAEDALRPRSRFVMKNNIYVYIRAQTCYKGIKDTDLYNSE